MYKINICFLSLILASCGGGDQTTLGENVSNPTNPNENVSNPTNPNENVKSLLKSKQVFISKTP